MDVIESIAKTNATAGQAVVVAGGTVMVAILGLQMAGIPFVAALGYSASIVVAVAVLIAITLLPALPFTSNQKVDLKALRESASQLAPKAAIEALPAYRKLPASVTHPAATWPEFQSGLF